VFGSITIDGANAPAGTVVTALSGSTACDSASYTGSSYQIQLVAAVQACWLPPHVIQFRVAGRLAHETLHTPANAGVSVEINLTVGGSGR
jgi:hypothetical protein